MPICADVNSSRVDRCKNANRIFPLQGQTKTFACSFFLHPPFDMSNRSKKAAKRKFFHLTRNGWSEGKADRRRMRWSSSRCNNLIKCEKRRNLHISFEYRVDRRVNSIWVGISSFLLLRINTIQCREEQAKINRRREYPSADIQLRRTSMICSRSRSRREREAMELHICSFLDRRTNNDERAIVAFFSSVCFQQNIGSEENSFSFSSSSSSRPIRHPYLFAMNQRKLHFDTIEWPFGSDLNTQTTWKSLISVMSGAPWIHQEWKGYWSKSQYFRTPRKFLRHSLLWLKSTFIFPLPRSRFIYDIPDCNRCKKKSCWSSLAFRLSFYYPAEYSQPLVCSHPQDEVYKDSSRCRIERH